MVAVRKLQTQTEGFWRDEYEVSDKDLDFLAGLILEAGKPQRLDMLVSAVIMRRLQLEKEAVARQAKSGRLYQPMGQYEVGQELAFSALDFVMGRVVAVRPGHNPKYGPFSVIQVDFTDGSPAREFAAGLDIPHPLNRPAEELLGGGGEDIDEKDLVRSCEHYVARRLEPTLAANSDFVRFNGMWFLKELLPEIHVGHLNLAEAMIYEAAHPLAGREILNDLDLAAIGATDAQLFALNHAMGVDQRFDNVSMGDEPIWYLRALEPEAVFHHPEVLKPSFQASGGEYLGLTMLDLVDEVGDELDDIESTLPREANGRESEGVHFEVSYPHLYAGTMPATARFLRLLPAEHHRHFPLTMVDSKTNQRFEAWVLPTARYVCGLGDWYASVGMCVGGQVSVVPLGAPLTFSLSVTPVRGKRSEWIRSASVVDDNLVLQMQRATVEVKCDRNMLTDIPNRQTIATLMARASQAQFSLSTIVRTAFEELAKLSGRGIVHAKAIYAIANLLRRTGAVPIFAELTRRACYDPVGDSFWAYDPSLEGTVYRTPEEMRERPQSRREDLIKDQVTQYLGR